MSNTVKQQGVRVSHNAATFRLNVDTRGILWHDHHRTHQTIISSLISAHFHSAFVILLQAINKPVFTEIKARHQTMAEAYLSEKNNYEPLSQRTNTH